MQPQHIGVIGIDPGLVHTGAVRILLLPEEQKFSTDFLVVDGVSDAELDKLAEWCSLFTDPVFIEAYRPRSHFQNDARMGKAVNDLKRLIPRAKSLDNTGVKQVVKTDFMKALDVWTFPVVTHHQDLRSAARIGLYGLMKDEASNEVLADFIRDHLEGNSWLHL